jgi:hypothetical protein
VSIDTAPMSIATAAPWFIACTPDGWTVNRT